LAIACFFALLQGTSAAWLQDFARVLHNALFLPSSYVYHDRLHLFDIFLCF
jgi:hypothetical protein